MFVTLQTKKNIAKKVNLVPIPGIAVVWSELFALWSEIVSLILKIK
jgi:hypothetical protein